MVSEQGQRDSFIVRIWREQGQPGWWCWVQHAATGETVVVDNLGDLLAFLESKVGKLSEIERRGLQ